MVEQLTLNQFVSGSSPDRGTICNITELPSLIADSLKGKDFLGCASPRHVAGEAEPNPLEKEGGVLAAITRGKSR